MYVTIDESACVGCGSCEALCPAVFTMTDRGTAEPIAEATEENKPDVEEAMKMCPASCISWDE